MTQEIGLTETRKRLSELVARAADNQEQFIIERRGKPIAVLSGLPALNRKRGNKKKKSPTPKGLLAAARLFSDYEEFEEVMAEVCHDRPRGRSITLS